MCVGVCVDTYACARGLSGALENGIIVEGVVLKESARAGGGEQRRDATLEGSTASTQILSERSQLLL
jgi:hypothetical protein